ncbi:MAG: hypothetical protein GY803_29825 [Chloroflexi bacterium]|nr:hypothetical protein [Chloroflexota bacterium]
MELKFTTFTVEAVTSQFLLRGSFKPRGDLFIYLNDRRHLFFHFDQVEFAPMATGYQINTVKQPSMNINWAQIIYLALLDEEIIKNLQVLQAKRPVVFYTDKFAIRGDFHVNPDAHEHDLVDDVRDFLVVSQAAVYPLRSLATKPTKKAPLLALNRRQIVGYHVYEPK